jgi:hypothetical protein
MYLTQWLACDGYFETFASFTVDSPPCLKVRIVKESKGKYRPCLRIHPTGIMVANDDSASSDIEIAKQLARTLLGDFLAAKGKEVSMR